MSRQSILIVNRSLVAAALMLGFAACGGDGGSSPTGPSTPPPDDATTITIVGMNGAQSFSPNPATIPSGQRVVWHNVDTTTHRVVLNNGTLDTGNIAPGAFSQPMMLGERGPYHCSIHPEMVGTLAATP